MTTRLNNNNGLSFNYPALATQNSYYNFPNIEFNRDNFNSNVAVVQLSFL
jgi:hypothetical protein